MATINTTHIANELKISRNTVSKALNNSDEVSEKTKQLIISTAIKMGYNKFKSNNNINPVDYATNKDIVLLVHEDEMANNFWSMILKGVEEYLSAKKFRIVFGILDKVNEENNILPIALRGSKPSGIIMIGSYSKNYYEMIHSLDIEFVSTDTSADIKDHELINDVVFMNGESNVYEITEYLIKKGVKDLAFVGDINWSRSIQDRWKGFRSAMMDNHIEINHEYDLLIYPSYQDGIKRFDSVADDISILKHVPSAFVCANDIIAYKVIKILKSKGLRVPEDAFVTGFDNFDPENESAGKLTTVYFDLKEIGVLAARHILWRIENPKAPYSITRLMSKVVYGASTDIVR